MGPPAPQMRYLPAKQEAVSGFLHHPVPVFLHVGFQTAGRKRCLDSSERPAFKQSPSAFRKGFEGEQQRRALGGYPGSVALSIPCACLWLVAASPLCCSGFVCEGERLEAEGCAGEVVPKRQRLSWRHAGTSGPASFPHPFSSQLCRPGKPCSQARESPFPS